MKQLQQTDTAAPSILYRGRALTQAEILGFAGGSQPLHRAAPVVLSGWLGFLLVLCNPIAGVAALVAAPLVSSHFHRSQPLNA